MIDIGDSLKQNWEDDILQELDMGDTSIDLSIGMDEVRSSP